MRTISFPQCTLHATLQTLNFFLYLSVTIQRLIVLVDNACSPFKFTNSSCISAIFLSKNKVYVVLQKKWFPDNEIMHLPLPFLFSLIYINMKVCAFYDYSNF